MGNIYSGSNTGKAGLEITEEDGNPDVYGVSKIIVSNGALTDNGNGSVTLTMGGGGAATAVGGTTRVTGAPPAMKMQTATGAQLKDGTTQSQALAGLGGGGTTVVAPSSSNVSHTSSNTSLVSGAVMSYDSYDPLSGTRAS